MWTSIAVFGREIGVQGHVFEGADHDRRGLEVSLNQAGWCMHIQISVTNYFKILKLISRYEM